MVISDTGANITGTANVSGNANVGNLGTAALIATGNVNFTTSPNVSLGAVGNLKITGGTADYVLQTDGTGNLSWVAQSGGGGGASIANGNSNVNIATANGNVTISAVGNANILVVTGTGANITGYANITGTANVNLLSTPNVVATTINSGLLQNGNSNVTIAANANVSISANGASNVVVVSATGANIIGTGNFSGNLSAANLIGPVANGNSNINIPSANGNVNISAAGNANVIVVTGTDAIVGGNVQVGAVNANSSLTFNANTFQTKLFASNALTANYSLYLPTGAPATNGLSVVANTDGTLSYVEITSYTAQPTIKFTAASNGNNQTFSNANIASFGNSTAFSSVYRNGVLVDSSDYAFSGTTLTMNVVLVTGDTIAVSSTNLAASPASGYVAGTNTQVQFNDAGAFGASSSFIFNKSSSLLTVANATISGTANVTGNLTVGNLIGPHANGNSNINIPAANGNVNISAVGNANILVVTGTGVNVAGTLNATGNITGNTNGFTIGYLNVPQLAASNTTLALTDAGKHYYSTTAGNFTLTIPNNTSAAFATGTAISIVVQAAGNILVNAASGVTLYLAGNSTAANRVVGAYGMATLMKVGTDTWFINGTTIT
jgi:hypothetical protein